ncbi:MAG: glycosyltransferase family 4 protein [Moorea sp. SIO3I7]|nr:glycosyltransferase family 4 protein [Moorena sp. SIO3I7]
MYRHLVLKQDFEVAVAGTTAGDSPIERRFVIRKNRLIERLRRTRLSRLLCNLEYLQNWIMVPQPLMQFAQEFRPDVVVCVIEDWHMGLAWQIATRLNVPLVVNFQDLFCLSQFVPDKIRPFPWLVPFLVNRYRMLNRKAAQSFYTSEGMGNWFGQDGRGDVLYPIGDFSTFSIDVVKPKPQTPLQIVYAGNCYGAYGRMLLRLANTVKERSDIHLQIFAAGNDWPLEKVQEMTEAGIYKGFKPFEQLKSDFQQADAFLTVMSFEKAEEPFMKTSFTTKWLDYVPYGKPVFVWAPDYSTAYQFAHQHRAGIAVSEDDSVALVKAMIDAASNLETWQAACGGARKAAETVLNAEKIHALFVEGVNRVSRQSQDTSNIDDLKELAR